MTHIGRTFDAVDLWIWRLLKLVALASILVLFVLLLGNVAFRLFKLGSFGWFDEIVEMSFAYLVFCGAAALCREGEHFKIEWLEDKLEGRRELDFVLVLVELITLTFFVLFFLSGWRLAARARDITPILELRKSLLYASLPAAGAGMMYFSIRTLIKRVAGLFK
jgi:TRAP-type C4-dicarboxylate transport system permease small subunit